MTVQTLLALKGVTVHKIEPTASIACAAKILSDHDIGALMVTDVEGAIVGIISERDIMRVLSARGRAALDTLVAEVMTRRVMTCSRHDRVDDIMQRMTDGKLRHLPVVEDERIIGIVSIRDVVKRQLEEMEQDLDALREYAGSKLRARQNVLQNNINLEQARFPRVF
ncbi:MAG: CBS domain-containing protein [Rhodoplanes sp.]